MAKSANSRCRRTTRKCVNGKCYTQKKWRKKTARKRCKKGSRKCGDNRCYTKV